MAHLASEDSPLTYPRDPVLVFPDERILYSSCEPCVPVQFELGLDLAQAFVPTISPCAHIPYFVRMRPKDSDPDDTRACWPRAMNGMLELAHIRRLEGKQKLKSAPNFGKYALKEDSFRVGVQRAVLEWIFKPFRINVCYTIGSLDADKNGLWRIEPTYGLRPLPAQWDLKNDVRQNLLKRLKL